MAKQQDMKRKRDALRLLLQQRLGPEDAAEFEPNLDSLIRAGFTTAGMIEESSRHVLGMLGLPFARILKLGAAFGIDGEPLPLLARCPVSSDVDAAEICCQPCSSLSGTQMLRAGGISCAHAALLQFII